MSNNTPPAPQPPAQPPAATEDYRGSTPYKDAFDIAYPQENLEGEMYKHRCKFCKRITTDINGRLENHAPDCAYRLERERELRGDA